MTISVHPDTPQGRPFAGSPASDAAPAANASGTRIRSRLFTKYVALFVAVVAVALLSNGIFEVFFYYREHKAALIRIQREQAEAAATKISQFIKEIESQLGWTTQLPWSAASLESRRFDALRLLRQVPAITELAQVDSTGHERLRVSRLAMDVIDSGLDLSKDPKFTEAVAHKVYYGPVYFRRESEPYMTLALAGTRKDAGVSIAEVNLKLIWDVVSQIKVGEHGHAYVVGSQGRLIAHPDISLVLRNTDMSKLVQVKAALDEQAALAEEAEQAAQAAQSAPGARPPTPPPPSRPQVASVDTNMASLQGALNIQGQEVLTAYAPISPLRWLMFVELPEQEAYASLHAALQRLAIVLLAASIFAVLAGIFLARRMVGPIQALRAGAARIGGGDFGQRISIKTGDELEGLANQFNDMGTRLQESYADLENKVEQRTAELSETLLQQTATADVLKVISSSAFELKPVFDTIIQTASRLCEAEFGLIYRLHGDQYEIVSANNAALAFVEHAVNHPLRPGRGSLVGRTAVERKPVHIPDCLTDAEYTAKDYQAVGHYRTILGVPLLREGVPVGVIILLRTAVRPFTDKQIELVTTFADQAVIAIENARLFEEVQTRTHELSESLEQQTATSEVLEVISSSTGELEPVFKKMLENATRVCGANFGQMNLYEDELFHPVANYNVPPAYAASLTPTPFQAHPQSGLGTVARTHEVLHIEDIRTLPSYLEGNPSVVAIADLAGARSYFVVPMLKENELIGAITIYRQEVKPFTDKQSDLVANFASQAVIAIENTRLLKELRQRTGDLTESLEQQTATSEVLQVISSSQGELDPVFQTMLENATRVCGASFGTMNLWDGEKYNIVATHNIPPAFAAYRQREPIVPLPGTSLATVVETHRPVQVPDLKETSLYKEGVAVAVGLVDVAGARTILVVPMLKDDELLGAITILRQEVRQFTDKQVALVENFTKQAVIAIENTRLLNELRDRTDELSHSLDDLRTAQDRLVQTEKLASLGQLTAGIAHEIKNPLNFVNNFSALSGELIDELNDLLKSTEMDGKSREEADELTHMLKSNLEKVVQHGKRADSIVKNMLLHSREGSGEHRDADINAIVEESLNLAYHGARAEKSGFNITLRRDLDPAAGSVDLYPQEITRVLLNLISNGFYAATKRKESSNGDFEPTLSASTKNLGNRVEIRIRDNGTGIPESVKEKMFNPFFTTKPAGEGTGLGLSMSHDIVVKQHGGKIDVDTEPGVFTEFVITLPRKLAAQGAGQGGSQTNYQGNAGGAH